MSTDILRHFNETLAGRYVAEREVGRGGMATVYLARDLRHDRRVAVKVLDPELGAVLGAERFLAEIRVTANLQHPNLLPLFDSGEASGLLYYVMPYVEGETLRARLAREKQLPVEEAVHIAVAVASALDYAHRHGVIHRDLKPENILLHEAQPLVADFGIALAISNAGGNRVTQTGLSLGTPQYMSPEQATADRQIDGRTDVYSLGTVLYEMLTGDPPHTGSTAQAIIARVLTDRPRPVRALRDAVPAHVDAAVLKALAKLPADRWGTPREFADALTHPSAVALPPGIVTPGSLLAVRGRTSSRSRQVVGALAAAVCVLAAVVVWQARAIRARQDDTTVRFALALDSIRLPDIPRGVAFSPDGHLVAYVGVTGNGRAILVRDLSEVHSRVITTGGMSQLVFSPDARSIAFVTGSVVQRVAVAGGPPSDVARLTTPIYGVAWAPDGAIVLGTAAGLVTLPSGGGAPRMLTRPDSAHGETSQRWPLLLPDGKTLVYESVGRTGTADDARLGLASRSTGKSTRMDVRGACPLGLVDGRLVFATAAGALAVAPFDARRNRITDEPVPVLDSLYVGPSGCLGAALSAEGSLVYQRGLQLSEVVAVDLHGGVRPVLSEPRTYASPRYSPDGGRIAVSIRSPLGTDIWIHDVRASTLTRLTTEGATNSAPEWSPDGKRVLWVSDRGGARALWWRAADGSTPAEPLLHLADREVTSGMLARDGATLVYGATDPGPGNQNIPVQGDVWWRRLPHDCAAGGACDTTARPVATTRFFEGSPRLSPDGRWVAYASNESGDLQVYVRPFPGPGARYQVSTRRAMAPGWSPDGRTLYYVTADRGVNELVAATLRTAPEFTVVSRTTVFQGSLPVGPNSVPYDVSPDGTHLLVERRVGTDAVVVVHDWAAELRRALGSR